MELSMRPSRLSMPSIAVSTEGMSGATRWLGNARSFQISPEVANHHVVQLAAAALQREGFRRCEAGALAMMETQMESYLRDFIGAAQDLAESGGRTKADIRDFGELFSETGLEDIAIGDLADADIQYARIPELTSEMKRDRKRLSAGRAYSKQTLSRTKVPLSPPPRPTLALPDTDLPAKLVQQSADYADHAEWLPELPPRHTWLRTYPEPERIGESSKQAGGVKIEEQPVAIAPPTSTQPGVGNIADADHATASNAHPPEPPKITVKVQRTSHLSQQSVKYLVSTLSESSNIPLELGIINHRQNPMALKRKMASGDREKDKGAGDETGRYDIFGEMGKKRKVVLKKNNDGKWVVPNA